MQPRLLQILAALAAVTLVTALSPASAAPSNALPARAAGEALSDYIVVFKDGTNARAQAALLGQAGARVSHVYENLFPGVGASLTDRQVRTLQSLPFVELVEANAVAYMTATQSSATWGIDRVDQADLPLSGTYNYTADGTGVSVFVIDSGIKVGHTEFGARRAAGWSYVDDGIGSDDCNGHGTHVAGTIGGATYGVAKDVTLVPVRVFPCSGGAAYDTIIAAMDAVAADSAAKKVVSMSLGGPKSTALNSAVDRLTAAGVPVVVAAGNDNRDACQFSPASAASAITVGATSAPVSSTNKRTGVTTNSESRASYSNYGTCVDIFAPGSAITSAWYTSTSATNTISGTSMATPHVSGAVALLLESATSDFVAAAGAVVTNATAGKISSVGKGSPNLMLFTKP